MKRTDIILIVALLLTLSCDRSADKQKGADDSAEGSSAFSGVRSYYEGDRLTRKVSYTDDVRDGETITYYNSGKVKQIIVYRKGLRTDTAKWFYEDGKLFRLTPYVNDTIHGTQIQYYRSKRPKAMLEYRDGLRVAGVREFYDRNKEKENNVRLTVTARDEYTSNGVYKLFAETDNKSLRVQYYRGHLVDGLFDPDKVQRVVTSGGMGLVELTKGRGTNDGFIGIIAEYITSFGNKDYVYKRVPVPYKDVY